MNDPGESLDRLTTSDAEGRRLYVYPADSKGRFRTARSAVQVILLLVFLVLPWIRIGGHQAILLDIARRRFAIFGLSFWAHDAPMLFFVFGGAALTLAFVTAVWGRVWCGWACPQTVFIDGVFRRIERWIEGDHVVRRALDAQPWDTDKFFKKAVKWSLFSAVSLLLTHSFLAYFVGTDALEVMIRRPPAEHPASFAFMAAATAVILFDFGWFREQFCTVVCPYGRFQSILMDDRSLAVAYNVSRDADCVKCFRCVRVCPTGIDIRHGL
jgi:cytochrome c oxidase accessory protein FixG